MAAVRLVRKVVVAVVGLTVLGIGFAMIVLPGPSILVIPLGLAILATEFLWARRLLRRFQDRVARAALGKTTKTASTDTKQT